MDAAQNIANVRSAESLVAIQLGIDSQGGDWRAGLTYEQRVAFDKALAAYIVAHPGSFAAGTVATAQLVVGQNLTPLADTSFDWDSFSSGVVDTAAAAGVKLGDVGNGVVNLVSGAGQAVGNAGSVLKWLIPLALVIAAGIALWAFKKKAGA